jgi:hypothetical protein
VAPLARRRFDDADDVFDSDLYDPKYYPRRVFRDGKGLRVPVMLTDAMPPEYRAAVSRRPLYDASAHRPHFAVVDASDPHVRAAERAYYERSAWLQDAWKTPTGQMQQPPDNGNGNGNGDDDDGEDLSPRDEYINRVSNAWRTPVGNVYGNGNGSEADAIQRAFIARISPGGGARPGAEAEAIEAARGAG